VQEPFFLTTLEKNERPLPEVMEKLRGAYEVGKPFIQSFVFSKASKQQSKKQQEKAEQYGVVAKRVLDYLNMKTGVEYGKIKPEAHLKPIIAILKAGYTPQDCITVIDKKFDDWWENPEMKIYLRPSTLFKPDKFDNYLNQPIRNGKGSSKFSGDFIEQVGSTVAKAIELNNKMDRNAGGAAAGQGH
jgi:uncharacterized phage protein (TIGR02220 family)